MSKIDIGNWSENAQRVYEHLGDDESRFLFEWRLKFMFERNLEESVLEIVERYNDWQIPSVYKDNDIIIYGYGTRGSLIKRMLNKMGVSVSCYCDSFIEREKTIDELRVLNVKEAVNQYKNGVFIISSKLYELDMINMLIKHGVGRDRVLTLRLEFPCLIRGNQYFDFFQSDMDEVFIDAGAYNGDTTKNFFVWAGNKAKKSIMFELSEKMCEKIIERNKDDDRVEIYNAATWNKTESIYFSEAGPGSAPSDYGTVPVNAMAIDSVIGDEKVTFIKMDIEGSELKALEGCKDTIKRCTPKLAICIYHKPNDIIELGSYILSLVPEYNLYIRHYTSSMEETLMYAAI